VITKERRLNEGHVKAGLTLKGVPVLALLRCRWSVHYSGIFCVWFGNGIRGQRQLSLTGKARRGPLEEGDCTKVTDCHAGGNGRSDLDRRMSGGERR